MTTPDETPAGKPAESTPALRLYLAASLDGYIASPPGGVEWLDDYDDAAADAVTFMESIGSAIMGRATYDFAMSHGPWSFGEMPVAILTHRPIEDAPPGVFTVSGDVRPAIARLKRESDGDIWLMGGGQTIRACLEADLVDTWELFFMPVVLGAGIPLLPETAYAVRRLRLADARTYGSGAVSLRYERAEPARAADH